MKIPLSRVFVNPRMEKSVLSALRSGNYILGEQCRLFEREFAGVFGVKHAVAVNSGTSALLLALRALGVKTGDEILVPSLTAFPTVEPVLLLGAKPVFVDVDAFYTMDAAHMQSLITPRTAGIIPVHLYGQPAAMDVILSVARKKRLFVIEDCAQAAGAAFRGKRAGTMGDAGCFSFYPSKNMTVCGDGGMVVTNRADLAEKVGMLRNHGRMSKYLHECAGYNMRFNELQAALGRVQLKHLDSFNESRRRIAFMYRGGLGKNRGLALPEERKNVRHVYHLFVVRTAKRDALLQFLKKNGVETGIHYPVPCHLQPAVLNMKMKRSVLPQTEKFCGAILSLPMYPSLGKKQIQYITNLAARFSENRAEN